MTEDKKKVLLLIEDNPLLTGMYKAAFEKRSVAVEVAHDGNTGFDMAKQMKPEVILLDLLMPGIDGLEVLRLLKEDKTTKDIKVVILTIDATEENRKKAMNFGIADFLIKQEMKLNEIVERVLSHFNHE